MFCDPFFVALTCFRTMDWSKSAPRYSFVTRSPFPPHLLLSGAPSFYLVFPDTGQWSWSLSLVAECPSLFSVCLGCFLLDYSPPCFSPATLFFPVPFSQSNPPHSSQLHPLSCINDVFDSQSICFSRYHKAPIRVCPNPLSHPFRFWPPLRAITHIIFPRDLCVFFRPTSPLFTFPFIVSVPLRPFPKTGDPFSLCRALPHPPKSRSLKSTPDGSSSIFSHRPFFL